MQVKRTGNQSRWSQATEDIRSGFRLPLTVIAHGNRYYYAFLIVLIGAAAGLLSAFRLLTLEQIKNLSRGADLSFRTTLFLEQGLNSALWLFVVPFILTAVALPVQNLYLREDLHAGKITAQILSALRDGFRSVILAFLIMLRVCFPAILLLAFMLLLGERSTPVKDHGVVLPLTMIVSVLCLIRFLPYLFLPLFSVFGRVHPLQCVHLAPAFFKREWIEVLFFSMFGIGLAALIYLAARLLPLESAAIDTGLSVAYLVLLWYVLTAMAVPVMRVFVNR